MKLAIVHDWLTGMRGGERVLEALCTHYPDAELFTLIHVRGSVAPVVERRRIHTSLAQRFPAVRHYYRKCLPLYPALVERFDLERFDVVINVAGRVRRYYNREALVVYPPVDTEFFHPDSAVPERFALVVSALVPYKRLEVAIDACRRARMPLKIVGTGPDRERLERRADGGVEFLGWVADADLRQLYRRASFALMTGEEDFGIAPLEAQACGRPVVALARGGALESILPGETGLLVDTPAPEAFAEAIGEVERRRFDPVAIRRHAERFSRVRFAAEIDAALQDTLASAPTRRAPRVASGAEVPAIHSRC